MGRNAPKYPAEAISALYALAIDQDLPVIQAIAEVTETHGVEIVESTAYSYVQRERVRRSMEASLLPADQLEALHAVAQRWLDLIDAETRRIERAAKRGSKPLEVDRLRALARASREALPVFEMCRQSKPTDPDEAGAGESVPVDTDETSPRREHSPEAARLLAAHEADREDRARLETEALERDEGSDQAGPIAGNGDTPVDVKAQAEIQAYVDRMAARRRLAP